MARKTLQEALGKVQRVHQHQLLYDNHTETAVGGGRKEGLEPKYDPRQTDGGRLSDVLLYSKGNREHICTWGWGRRWIIRCAANLF